MASVIPDDGVSGVLQFFHYVPAFHCITPFHDSIIVHTLCNVKKKYIKVCKIFKEDIVMKNSDPAVKKALEPISDPTNEDLAEAAVTIEQAAQSEPDNFVYVHTLDRKSVV